MTDSSAVHRDELEASRFAGHWTHRGGGGACAAEKTRDDFMMGRGAVNGTGGRRVAVAEAIDQGPHRCRDVLALHGCIMVRFRPGKECDKKLGASWKTRRQPTDLWVESNACDCLPRGSAFQETARMLFVAFFHARSNTCLHGELGGRGPSLLRIVRHVILLTMAEQWQSQGSGSSYPYACLSSLGHAWISHSCTSIGSFDHLFR